MGSMQEALKPLHFISMCLGIHTFKINSKGYSKSSTRKYFLVLAICVYFTAASICAYFFALTSPSLIPQTFIVEYVFGYFQIVTIWGSAIYYQELHLELMATLGEVDKRLHKLGVWLFYSDLKKYVLKRISFHAGVVVIIISLQLYTDRNIRVERIETIFFMALFYVPIIISFGVVENIGIFINVVKDRFRILNTQLEELKTNNVSDSKKLEVLRIICPIHLELTHLTKGISKCFGFTLLLTFSVNFITIMIGCYIICVAFQYLNRNLVLIVVPQTLLGIATYLVNTYYLCYCGQSVVRECNRSGLLLHALDFEDIKVKDQIQMFSMQILNEDLQFTAAGFFSVDYSLLFSIIGGLTTYIIILIQFSTNSGESINRYYDNA